MSLVTTAIRTITAALETTRSFMTPKKRGTTLQQQVSKNVVPQRTGHSPGQPTDLAVGVTLGEGSIVVTGPSTETTGTTGLVNTDRVRHVEEPDIRLTSMV
ncbi:hypothetical protein PF005_g15903 [Phytophthora fragariae]|uniref:Uncharacterized protein n=1 Tax=Phytophthora fragariae TaxID=53985 RepID=A0A6A3I5N1_9STRA|nr:hypothetical protein PF003_g33616 [Phytophthora fragariae]KAE8923430.1 hypothetical protein PF009_g26315 [Phytophthora fragariae]KAE8975594.1 hypothetical protein PF011_g24393 [Phytophthora fragariae]KAE9102494.1 hypothetical protein PF007_g14738 [Phytophthora fragariae]KAE9132899.1 hypothetical protein PF010_g3007 [Phytophthora fragariae]